MSWVSRATTRPRAGLQSSGIEWRFSAQHLCKSAVSVVTREIFGSYNDFVSFPQLLRLKTIVGRCCKKLHKLKASPSLAGLSRSFRLRNEAPRSRIQSYHTLFSVTVRKASPSLDTPALRDRDMAPSLSIPANRAATEQNWTMQGSDQQMQQQYQRQASIYPPIAPAATSERRSTLNPSVETKRSKRRRVACKDCRQAKVSFEERTVSDPLLPSIQLSYVSS